MVRSPRRLLARGNAFAACAVTYWIDVFPNVRREASRWSERAAEVPGKPLRDLALATQRDERGNLEGAGAFAVLAPCAHRLDVTRAAVAFQAAYDFVDTLAEQPCADPRANGRRLHLVLLAALDPDRPHLDYLASGPFDDDGGYLVEMADRCREALRRLPSYAAARPACLRAAERMVAYQSLTHARTAQRPEMRRWAEGLTPAGAELRWWEAAAGAASSLSVFALMAAAAQPGLREADANALESSYFPVVGALHVLLDSLIDSEADLACDHHSLVAHYSSPEQTAERLGTLARRAGEALAALPTPLRHEAVLAAMVCFYLSSPAAGAPGLRPARRQVLAESGGLTHPAMALLRARRAITRSCGGRRTSPSAGLQTSPSAGLQTSRSASLQTRRLAGLRDSRRQVLESQVVDFPLAPVRAPRG